MMARKKLAPTPRRPQGKRARITWYLRGEDNWTHNAIGRSLSPDDTAEESHLHRELKTSTGVWPAWDCGKKSYRAVKPIVMSFLQEAKKKVFIYKQHGNDVPREFDDQDTI